MSGDILYGVVMDKKKIAEGHVQVKLFGIKRSEPKRVFTLLEPMMEIALIKIRSIVPVAAGKFPVAFPKLNGKGREEARLVASSLEEELCILRKSEVSTPSVSEESEPNASAKSEPQLKEDPRGDTRVMPIDGSKSSVDLRKKIECPCPIDEANKKYEAIFTLPKKPGAPRPLGVLKKKRKRNKWILDPEDSDFEINVTDRSPGEEFREFSDPKLGAGAMVKMRESKGATDQLESGVQEMLFRVGHQEVPMVTRMRGADLQMLSLLEPQPRMDADWLGFAKTTSDEHLSVVKLFASNVDPKVSLIDTLVASLEQLRIERKWRWSTTLKRAASLQGALAVMPLYFKGCVPVYLKRSTKWVKHLSHCSKKAKEETPSQARPMTVEEVAEAIEKFRTVNPEIAVALMIGWLTAARLGCILQLRMEDVQIKDGRFAVTFKKGKGVKLRGPYTVFSQPLPPQWMDLWNQYSVTRNIRLFPESLTGEKLRKSLKAINPELEQRSIRRGSLQTMSKAGVVEETLMRFSGHTQVATLRRYLNWNQVNTHVQEIMAEAAVSLLPTFKDEKAEKLVLAKGPKEIIVKRKAPPPKSSSAKKKPVTKKQS